MDFDFEKAKLDRKMGRNRNFGSQSADSLPGDFFLPILLHSAESVILSVTIAPIQLNRNFASSA